MVYQDPDSFLKVPASPQECLAHFSLLVCLSTPRDTARGASDTRWASQGIAIRVLGRTRPKIGQTIAVNQRTRGVIAQDARKREKQRTPDET
jgi:hypothetical protein